MVTNKCYACKRGPAQTLAPYLVRFIKHKYPNTPSDVKFCSNCITQIKHNMRVAQQARLNLHGSSQTTGTSLETETLNQTNLSQSERRSSAPGPSTATPQRQVQVGRVPDTVDRLVSKTPNLPENRAARREIEGTTRSFLDTSLFSDSRPLGPNVTEYSSDSSNQVVSSSVGKTPPAKQASQKRANSERNNESESQTINYSQVGTTRARLVVREYETDDDTSDEDTPPARQLDTVGPIVKKRKVTTTFPPDDDIPIYNTSRFGG